MSGTNTTRVRCYFHLQNQLCCSKTELLVRHRRAGGPLASVLTSLGLFTVGCTASHRSASRKSARSGIPPPRVRHSSVRPLARPSIHDDLSTKSRVGGHDRVTRVICYATLSRRAIEVERCMNVSFMHASVYRTTLFPNHQHERL